MSAYMSFSTPEDRALVLQSIDDGESDISPGAAMAHARAVNLGAWGSRDMLRTDCARLLIGEMQRAGYDTVQHTVYVSRLGQRMTLCNAVLASSTFYTAFEHARHAREIETENGLCRMLGREPATWDAPSGNPVADDMLAVAVAGELGLGR